MRFTRESGQDNARQHSSETRVQTPPFRTSAKWLNQNDLLIGPFLMYQEGGVRAQAQMDERESDSVASGTGARRFAAGFVWPPTLTSAWNASVV